MNRVRRRQFLGACAVPLSGAFAGCSSTLEAGRTYRDAGAWSMHRHDTTNSGRRPTSSGPSDEPTVAWERSVAGERRYGRAYPAPVAVDESVIVGGDGLLEIDLRTGEVQTRLFEDETTFGPTVVDGTAYAASRPSEGTFVLRAIDLASQTSQWRTELSLDRPRAAPLVTTGERVYAAIGSGDAPEAPPSEHRLAAFDAESGERQWTVGTTGDYATPPAIRDGVVYAGAGPNGTVAAIGPECDVGCRVGSDPPSRSWTSNVAVRLESAPVVADGYVYAADQYPFPPERGGKLGTLSVFGADDGSLEWRRELGFHVTSPAVDDRTAFVAASRYDGRESGEAYGTAVDVYAFGDGEREWRTEVPDRRAWRGPVVAGDALYLGTLPSQLSDASPRIHALDPDSGAVRWSVDVPVEPCSLAVADDALVASGWNGTVVALR